MARGIELTGEYRETYLQIQEEILSNTEKGEATDAALRDIQDLLREAERVQRPIRIVFPEGLSKFCASVIDALPVIPVRAKYESKRNTRRLHLVLGALAVVLIASVAMWYFGIFAYWNQGMWALVNDVKNQQVHEVHKCRGSEQPFTLTLDMSDLKSNAGKVLYQEGMAVGFEKDCRIVVDRVDFTDDYRGRQYSILFRCYGSFDLNRTVYYTPRAYPAEDENYLASSMVFEGKEITPLKAYGFGPGLRDSYYVLFPLMLVPKDYVFHDPIVTVKFWELDGYDYFRTGWK